MTPEIKSFIDKHTYSATTNTISLPMEATRLAIGTRVVTEKHTTIFADQKWFKSTDLACKYLNSVSVFEIADVELPKYLRAADGCATFFVFAVAHSVV